MSFTRGISNWIYMLLMGWGGGAVSQGGGGSWMIVELGLHQMGWKFIRASVYYSYNQT